VASGRVCGYKTTIAHQAFLFWLAVSLIVYLIRGATVSYETMGDYAEICPDAPHGRWQYRHLYEVID
jgi:hypothetical protein